MKETKQDRANRKLFGTSYKVDAKPAIVENFAETVRLHVQHILENKVTSVLDVGMGTGGLLLALQNQGVKTVYGVELSPEGIELAKERFEKFGDISNAHFFEGSFLSYNPEKVDAVSLHQVLHCEPNFEGMIDKILEASPKVIINTMPRRTWYSRIFLGVLSMFTRIFASGFRAYVHSPEKMEQILLSRNYQKSFTKKGTLLETSLFISNNDVRPE